MADVFVSYARADKARVAPLVAAVEAHGLSVWWDPAISPGEEFDRLIADQLGAAAAVLVVWTASSVGSRWVRGEARHAADRGVLVPVRFGDAELPIDVRALHTTDLDERALDARNPAVRDVLRALAAMAARDRSARSLAAPVAAAPPAAAAESGRITICVLPLANLCGDAAQDSFCDGITEDIITELSRWRRLLSVQSRSASFRYRGVAVDMQQVARELGVRFIVEGSLRRLGERMRVTIQLIDAETGGHVWAEKFDERTDDMLDAQDRVVQKIVSTLVGRIEVSDAERARRKPIANLTAYECVLQGNELSWDDASGAAQARQLFEQAIELDPNYAMAHALLAALSYARWRDDFGDSDAELDQAYALAKRAVELDGGESTCHAILASVLMLRRSFDLAEEHARRAVQLNPTNQWNCADLAAVLVQVDRCDEALDWLKRAREIDPYFDQPWYWRVYGMAYMLMQRHAEAIAMFGHVRLPNYRIAALEAACHAELGDMEKARQSVAECLSMQPEFSVARYIRKNPFKRAEHAERLAASLCRAGLPEATGARTRGGPAEPPWVDEVLRYWFDEVGAARWFGSGAQLDPEVRQRFHALHRQIAGSDARPETPRALLAAVIVLDQFSRHLFRNTPRAYAADAAARRLAAAAIELGFDDALRDEERMFLYMPFQHSEDRADQDLSIKLFADLGNDGWLHYALEHKAIIDRFGRFPHRNAVLERPSTAEEIALLNESPGF